ncbi:MAG: adenosylhomocysteinase, partial [Candidatus Altarchaeaceae archaeon]
MYKIKDIGLAEIGEKKIRWAEDHMPVLMEIRKEFENNGIIKNLSDEQFKELYKKRIYCNELSYEEFVWHEKRKFNKGSIDDTRFDI